jgi:hypothetical protein
MQFLEEMRWAKLAYSVIVVVVRKKAAGVSAGVNALVPTY